MCLLSQMLLSVVTDEIRKEQLNSVISSILESHIYNQQQYY